MPHCYRPTDDPWHPCFPNHTVFIELIWLTNPPAPYFLARVAVWGGDDTGYERDFDTFDEAEVMYARLSKMITVNYETLKFYGFQHA